MPIDSFSNTEFEAALPRDKYGNALWTTLGVVDGEYCYLMLVTPHAGIKIRSSVRVDGHSADCGKDSIRLLVVSLADLQSRGSKLQKFVTRVPGWEKRMTSLLRNLWRMARLTGPCTHVSIDARTHEQHPCDGWISVYKCKKEDSPNKGRLFRKCSKNCRFFEWLPNLVKAKGQAQ